MIPQEAIDLILEAEGIDQPSQWPGGESGVTIGYGYDLGYENLFSLDWSGVLPDPVIARLQKAVGKKGAEAHGMASLYKDIKITREAALKVFIEKTLPHYEKETLLAFPGLEQFPDLAIGALVSLVFNRGNGMAGPRRAEMRAIRDAIAHGARPDVTNITDDLQKIADQLRAMKHLWTGRGLDGLLRRRDAEARLVEKSIGT